MSSTSQTATPGVSIIGLLGVLFIGLKLGGVISWSWLWILAPFWGGFALIIAFIIVWLIVVGLISLYTEIVFRLATKKQTKRNRRLKGGK